VDIFEQSQCADGSYVSAFTAEGILVWRRKISSGSKAGDLAAEVHTGTVDAHAASMCDSVSVGMRRDAVGELLKARKLQASGPENSWLIEENGTDCRLWFDANAQLLKKRKTLTSN
jgi:hypothetical protein